MNQTHKQFQEVFDELYMLTMPKKIEFLETLLFYFKNDKAFCEANGLHEPSSMMHHLPDKGKPCT